MTSDSDRLPADPDLIDGTAYEQANSEIATITSRMPRQAVEALAREVVSRLAGRVIVAERKGAAAKKYRVPSADDIEDLAHDLLKASPDAALQRIERLRNSGATMEEIYLNHLAQAARLMGEWWDTDRVTFVEVTVGAGRIYAIMRAIRSGFTPADVEQRRHAVFATIPGEGHSLGVTMAADLFRKRGWQIDLVTGQDHEELVTEIENTNCVLIGLSGSNLRAITSAARLIVALRVAVPASMILVSGQIALLEPNLQSIVGADLAVSDFETAYEAMERMLEAGPATRRRSTH